jgi:hypothetical protein
MSEGQKQALTLKALGLLNEQVNARIVHYKADLQTSPELDAVTAEVVAQLKAMQAAAAVDPTQQKKPEEVEAEQIRGLTSVLERAFSGERSDFVTQQLRPLGRRIAKLFFESELHEKTKGDKEKVIHHAEQGVFYVLQRYKNRLRAELEGFEYVSDEIRELTLSTLAKIERDLQVGFLSRRSPELNRIMTVFTAVLSEFLRKHLPPRLGQIAKLTIRTARTAARPGSVGYKVQADAFDAFRSEWERLLMEQMVNYCGDTLMARLGEEEEQFRDETIKFFTDPHVYSETCEVLCGGLYDFMCLEGFLDVSVDWRASLEQE